MNYNNNKHQEDTLACRTGYLLQSEDSPLEQGKGFGVDGLSVVGPA